jgi:hypothetical protein
VQSNTVTLAQVPSPTGPLTTRLPLLAIVLSFAWPRFGDASRDAQR